VAYIVLVALFAVYLIGPLIATVLFSVGGGQTPTLDYYRTTLADGDLLSSLGHSLFVSVCAVVLAILLCVPTVYWVQVRAKWAAPFLEVLTLLPFATQGVIMTMGMFNVYGRRPLLLVQTPWILILSYTMIGIPFMYRAVGNGFAAFDVKNLEWAARTLGAGFWSTLRLVMIPNVLPALVNGAILAFSTAMAEFPLAVYLTGSSYMTFPVYINYAGGDNPRAGAVVSLLSFVITLGCSLVVLWAARRGRDEGAVVGAVAP